MEIGEQELGRTLFEKEKKEVKKRV